MFLSVCDVFNIGIGPSSSQTGVDMRKKNKKTSLSGLAVNLPEC